MHAEGRSPSDARLRIELSVRGTDVGASPPPPRRYAHRQEEGETDVKRRV